MIFEQNLNKNFIEKLFNIHFYINRCGFKVVEFFNPKHKNPHLKGETAGNMPIEQNLFFKFEKAMK